MNTLGDGSKLAAIMVAAIAGTALLVVALRPLPIPSFAYWAVALLCFLLAIGKVLSRVVRRRSLMWTGRSWWLLAIGLTLMGIGALRLRNSGGDPVPITLLMSGLVAYSAWSFLDWWGGRRLS